jgi:hypothetical protein
MVWRLLLRITINRDLPFIGWGRWQCTLWLPAARLLSKASSQLIFVSIKAATQERRIRRLALPALALSLAAFAVHYNACLVALPLLVGEAILAARRCAFDFAVVFHFYGAIPAVFLLPHILALTHFPGAVFSPGLTYIATNWPWRPDRTGRNAERDDKWARRAAATARRDNVAHFEARALASVRGSVQISDDASFAREQT